MKYFWVNQNKTFKEESEAGILFAPLKGAKNQTEWHWKSMELLEVGDVVFSAVRGEIVSYGIVMSKSTKMDRPKGNKFERWDNEGWVAKVLYHKLQIPLEIKKFIGSMGHLFPVEHSPYSIKEEQGNQIYLAPIGDNLGDAISEALGIQYAQTRLPVGKNVNPVDKHSETEKEIIAKHRITHGKFKRNLLKLYKERCVVTGLKGDNFLIASHIKPWSISDNKERNDVNNGLLLAVPIDTLFDKRLISFNDDGSIIISKGLSDEAMQVFGINSSMRLRVQLTDENKAYLKTHRDNLK
jgi:putative restriction endonuclease